MIIYFCLIRISGVLKIFVNIDPIIQNIYQQKWDNAIISYEKIMKDVLHVQLEEVVDR